VILDAALDALLDLLIGAMIFLVFITPLLYFEARYERELPEGEADVEVLDCWAGLPERDAAPESSVEFGAERRAA
jgi:hypothetical protein